MVTEKTSRGTSQNCNPFGSGLSGMIAAHISAQALETPAHQDDAWQAQEAFRPRTWAWLVRRAASHGRGTAAAS
jgi:hypothetical protein